MDRNYLLPYVMYGCHWASYTVLIFARQLFVKNVYTESNGNRQTV